MEPLIIVAGLLFTVLGAWLAWATYQFSDIRAAADETAETAAEIAGQVEAVSAILARLPELMPQFAINQNPLQPLIEHLMGRWTAEANQSLSTGSHPRDAEGRYTNAPPSQSEEAHPP